VLIDAILGSLAGCSAVLGCWQWLAGRRFPLHRRVPVAGPLPGVTLLKPVKGCDAETAACLRSWLAQDYPGGFQVLFGVATPDDPAHALVRGLLAEYPHCDAELILCPKWCGPNSKVSKLVQLEQAARHEVLVISDADVFAPPDLLAQMAQPLQGAAVGLVHCLYCFPSPANAALRWEAFAINADFWSQVLQAQTIRPLDFALGAAMAVPRAWLKRIGGFNALTDCLADDYELGHRIALEGGHIALSPVVVECRSGPMTWGEVWRHQLRWARTIRACQPGAYFLSILSNGTFWPLLWLAVNPGPVSAAAAVACVGLRSIMACANESRILRRFHASGLWRAPWKDLLHLGIWLASFLGRHVMWRGERLRILRGGRLVRDPRGAANA
jgi:ceramide glucosyltransferase